MRQKEFQGTKSMTWAKSVLPEFMLPHWSQSKTATRNSNRGQAKIETTALAENPSALLQHADAPLYKAKREGRNQVWTKT
jgi:PleD family two-component response regulator